MAIQLWISLLVLPPNTMLLIRSVLRPATLSLLLPVQTWLSDRSQKLVNLAPCRCERVKKADGAGIHRSVQPPRERGEAAKWALSGTFSHQRLAACGRLRSWLYLWALMGGTELHFLRGTLLWEVCVGEGTVKACHHEPLPPVIYQGGMCFGGLNESLFPEPCVCCCVWALLKITILFQLHSFYRFFNIVAMKKKNHKHQTHQRPTSCCKKKEGGGTLGCFILATSPCGMLPS